MAVPNTCVLHCAANHPPGRLSRDPSISLGLASIRLEVVDDGVTSFVNVSVISLISHLSHVHPRWQGPFHPSSRGHLVIT